VATVDAILEAAARILERDGLGRAFGTNRIAREAGVSIGSLYEYFEGQDAIVRALCNRHVHNVRALVDRAVLELADAPIETAVEVFVDSLFSLHAARPALHRTLHHEFPLRFGLQPFIDSDRYIEEKLVAWLRVRMPEVDPDELSTRAFVAIRASRSVTIHAFAEGLCDDRKSRVRAAVKDLLLRTCKGAADDGRA
jgi:AcrR family transcriptional regulator